MDGGYNFLADLLTTFRSTSDLVKVAWFATSALAVISFCGVYLDYRLKKREIDLRKELARIGAPSYRVRVHEPQGAIPREGEDG